MITTDWFLGSKDLDNIHNIRREVFIIEQNTSEEEEWDSYDNEAIHLLVYDNKKPVATGRIIIVDDVCLLGRIAVLKDYRKQGFGDLVVRMLIRKAYEMSFERQEIHAQIQAVGFYEKLGFVPFGEEFMEAGIPHTMMYHEGDVQGCC